jgi:two-component system, cell cycle response regulator DivK
MSPRGRIVLIEDNEQSRYLAAYLLRHHGYEVDAAKDGATGLVLLAERATDLLLLDIQLPDMSGFEVLRELKLDPRTADVPVVAVSAFAMTGDRERALAAGCDGYIEKPIDPEKFVTQIQSLLRSP